MLAGHGRNSTEQGQRLLALGDNQVVIKKKKAELTHIKLENKWIINYQLTAAGSESLKGKGLDRMQKQSLSA